MEERDGALTGVQRVEVTGFTVGERRGVDVETVAGVAGTEVQPEFGKGGDGPPVTTDQGQGAGDNRGGEVFKGLEQLPNTSFLIHT